LRREFRQPLIPLCQRGIRQQLLKISGAAIARSYQRVGGNPVAGRLAIMKQMLLTTSVYESDLDMTRMIKRLPVGRVRRLLDSVFGNLLIAGTIEKPRRSIDRELQQYSPTYD
jgi:hypothetical protein